MKKRLISLALLIVLVLTLCPVQSYAATINNVYVTILVPEVGKTPDYDPVLPSSAGYYSANYTGDTYKNDVFWIDQETGIQMTVGSSTFIAGREYKLVIYLTPAPGNSFSDTARGYINGYEVTAAVQDDGQIRLACSFLVELNGWQKIDGKYYYYKYGAPVTWWQTIDGKQYYFDQNGALQTGFVNSNGRYYYLSRTNGSLQKGWVKEGSRYYYFDEIDYSLQTGFVLYGGQYYYFSKTDGSLQAGFVRDGSRYYYFSKTDGTLQYGWVKDSGKYYYFNPMTGVIQTGWLAYGGNYYYLSPTTGALQTGWVKSGGNYYYLNPATGALQTGWLDYNGSRYYLNPSTGAVLTGWLRSGYSLYYLKPDGTMAAGNIQIDGYDFIFGSDGIFKEITPGSKKRMTFEEMINWIDSHANAQYDGCPAYQEVYESRTYLIYYDILDNALTIICTEGQEGVLYTSSISIFPNKDYSYITCGASTIGTEESLFSGYGTVANTAFSKTCDFSFLAHSGPLDPGNTAVICRDSLVSAIRWLDRKLLEMPYNGFCTFGAVDLGFILIGAQG